MTNPTTNHKMLEVDRTKPDILDSFLPFLMNYGSFYPKFKKFASQYSGLKDQPIAHRINVDLGFENIGMVVLLRYSVDRTSFAIHIYIDGYSSKGADYLKLGGERAKWFKEGDLLQVVNAWNYALGYAKAYNDALQTLAKLKTQYGCPDKW